MTAFVLDLSENGYGILRALSREDVTVLGFYRSKSSFGRFSRLCSAHALKADEGGGLLSTLIEEGERVPEKPVLFPTSDDQVAILIRDQEQLRDRFLYHWLPQASWRNIVDKLWMLEVAKDVGLMVPRTRVTTDDEDVMTRARHFIFPSIIKPIRSGDVRFPSELKNFVARTPEDLVRFYRNAPRALGATIWQEIVEGSDDQIFQCNVLVRSDGELGAHVCVRKLRQYLPGFGVMSFGRSEQNDELVGASLKLLRSLDYRGLASLEFKKNSRDERYYFIEMNPRLPWYNSLFVATGVNLAWLAYMDLKAEETPQCSRQRDSVYWGAFRQDLGHMLQRRPNALRWLSSLARARSWAWWNPRDPLPFCHSTSELVRYGAGRLFGIKSGSPVEIE